MSIFSLQDVVDTLTAEGIDAAAIMRRYVVLLKEAGHEFPVNYPIN